MILLVDNYDSFTFNLAQQLAALGAHVLVARNDALSAAAALALEPSGVVLSPGPGHPRDAGICAELIARLPEPTPLLGVCLGHQALVLACGGAIERDPTPVHGKAARIEHVGTGLFADLPQGFRAARYHSLHAARQPWPDELELAAWTDDGRVMAVRHRRLPRHGVQFHPESVLTPDGDRIVARFLALCGLRPEARGAIEAYVPTAQMR